MGSGSNRVLAAVVALIVVGVALYANTFASPFVFDDTPSIEDNEHIEALWPLSESLTAPAGGGSSGRPLVAFSLAVNYALGGREVLGYHLFNILVHVLGALALFGVVRRACGLHGGVHSPTGLAFAIALLWTVHPLQSDALNQVIYRNESMMALFYLLSLLAALRVFAGASPKVWGTLCVLAAACSMASKEVAVSLPVVVLALDRLLGAGTFRAALRTRPAFYAGLAATWILLAWCVLSGDRGESVGFGHTDEIDGLDFLRTSAGAIVVYLRLTFWPEPLIFDYFGWPVAREWSAALLPGAFLAALFAISAYAFARRRIVGLLGLAFFAILSPSSSFIPVSGELVAEHRMVLPLACLIVIAVLAARSALASIGAARRIVAPALLLVAAGGLAATTWARNGDYESRVTLWQDTVEKRPRNSRAWNHLALALKNEARNEEASAAFERTLAIDPDHGKASYNYGNVLMAAGDHVAAARRYAVAARAEPENATIRYNHATALVAIGEVRQGIAEYRETIALMPEWEMPALALAWLFATHPDESVRNGREALLLAEKVNRDSGGRLARPLDTLAAALAETGDPERAAEVAGRAVQAAHEAGKTRFAQEIEARRRLYTQGRPFRTK